MNYWLPGTEPQMAMDGSWYQITPATPCPDCTHPIMWHGLAPWRCQNVGCDCPPVSRRRQRKT